MQKENTLLSGGKPQRITCPRHGARHRIDQPAQSQLQCRRHQRLSLLPHAIRIPPRELADETGHVLQLLHHLRELRRTGQVAEAVLQHVQQRAAYRRRQHGHLMALGAGADEDLADDLDGVGDGDALGGRDGGSRGEGACGSEALEDTEGDGRAVDAVRGATHTSRNGAAGGAGRSATHGRRVGP